MKKLFSMILVIYSLLSGNTYAEDCQKDITYEISWLTPNYEMIYIDFFNSKNKLIGIDEVILATKDGNKITSFKPVAVRDKNSSKSQLFTVKPYGKNFTSYPTQNINHKIVDQLIFACGSIN
tara:strand:- start:147 stop:512 length:366 start_codon:yes stop_codon:yes gene_type:complete